MTSLPTPPSQTDEKISDGFSRMLRSLSLALPVAFGISGAALAAPLAEYRPGATNLSAGFAETSIFSAYQTFTPTSSGLAGSVEVLLAANGQLGGDAVLKLSLFDALSLGAALTSTVFTAGGLQSSPVFYAADLSVAPVLLQAGQPYALHLEIVSGAVRWLGTTNQIESTPPTTDPGASVYAAGAAYSCFPFPAVCDTGPAPVQQDLAFAVSAVPLPGTLALMGAGLGVAAAAARCATGRRARSGAVSDRNAA